MPIVHAIFIDQLGRDISEVVIYPDRVFYQPDVQVQI
jgi:hypothetical protein